MHVRCGERGCLCGGSALGLEELSTAFELVTRILCEDRNKGKESEKQRSNKRGEKEIEKLREAKIHIRKKYQCPKRTCHR